MLARFTVNMVSKVSLWYSWELYIYTVEILILSVFVFVLFVHLTIRNDSDRELGAVMPQRVCYHHGR